ncbi:hypothetical protein KL918_000896 [Ogataea parapolymorpha]|uniref:Uncharacterized protein n=1 Tax=Ogataea parapolymorpha (strain ATCC 26012 / BCRC 20466 / JCM 22074 / NRRL Y-7560 / DL-1) TaxID=871575 RepID=W1QA63_OGAPD|nr:hypothetical protein HPODL_01392 [Ogataea parapolymorpha DL-1]ESW97289.1 hypothetical protein HPODL_01392 [Ogataea parapolymorpha DL-1]KAG7869351.1 hypothetical protein KL918_000896 [Ogataea parapolymorpha]KAG7875597.1 hypothetical protein KL916_000268 [Ogataea parapolymorpha]
MVLGGNYIALETSKNQVDLSKVRHYGLWAFLLLNIAVFLRLSYSLWNIKTPIAPFIELNVTNFEQYLQPMDFANASAVFNEVYDVLKQKNADINPISVSFIPAYIPEGTLLYHSNHRGQPPKTVEWVAMDYEFSYNFAHLSRNRPRKGQGPGGPGGPPNFKPPGGKRPSHGDHPPNFDGPSSLFTFQVTKPLDKVIVFGGASAAKSLTGEMDTQFVLSQVADYDDFDERIAADKICSWGKKHGGLDGYVRLEVGFEMVICDFEEKMIPISNVSLANATEFIDFPPEKFADLDKREDLNAERSAVIDVIDAMSGFEHYLAGARAYDGDKRILLDFSKFVTPLNKTFIHPDPYLRRIHNISSELKTDLVNSVEEMLSTPNDPYSSTNWQVVTDYIVDKFAPMLVNLNSSFALYGQHEDYQTLGTNLTAYTYNFIRRYLSEPDHELLPKHRAMAIWDYSHPYQPLKSTADFFLWNSITIVQSKIVDTLYNCFSLSKTLLSPLTGATLPKDIDDQITKAKTELSDLLESLHWAYYYRCSQSCNFDELCFVPTWGPSPLGFSNANSTGFYDDGSGRARIEKELRCINYDLLLQNKRG